MLPLILPTHLDPISRPLPSLPEPTSSPLPHQTPMTNPTLLGSIILLPTTPSANHAISPLIDMLFAFVVAFITGVYFLAAGEAEPAIGFGVMATTPSLGELGAGL